MEKGNVDLGDVGKQTNTQPNRLNAKVQLPLNLKFLKGKHGTMRFGSIEKKDE